MNYGLFGGLMSQVSFAGVVGALLAVFAVLVGVEVARKGARKVVGAIAGDRVFYGGRFYDRSVYDEAMRTMGRYKRAGGSLDRETARHYRAWRSSRARAGLF